ncbi:MAG: TolC family protein [candidate division WOR-3 bacterium]|nr:TolC family protein [candidate division WOR-3 bacterium]MCX7837358.1 TolC family protein [candidate division WOR-3 bacterium]MDW8113926.1 TolC family protein [candidate division WOR-3 bacterium]
MKGILIFLLFSIIYSETLVINYQKACSLAVENCLLLKASNEKLRQKYFDKLSSLANFFPQANLSFGYARLSEVPYFVSGKPIFEKYPFRVYDIFGNFIGITESIPIITGYQIESIPFGSKENYLLRITLNQPIFTFFKILRGYKIAQLNEFIEKESYLLTLNTIKKQVINMFYNLFLLKKQRELLKASYEQLKRHLNACSTLYRHGLLKKLDLLKTQSVLEGLEVNLVQIVQQESLLFDIFKLFLGLEEVEFLLVDSIIQEWEKERLILEKEEKNLDSLLLIAEKERKELKILTLTKEIIKNSIKIQRSSFLPNIVSSYNYDYKKPYSYFEDKWKGSWNFALVVNLPLSLGGGDYTKLKSLQHKLKEIDFYYNWNKELIKNEVRQVYFKYLTSYENFRVSNNQVKIAKEALKEAEEGFKMGKVSNLEYLDTELKLREAKLTNLRILIDNIITKKELDYAVGKEVN